VKLSDYILKQKDKGISKDWALVTAKSAVKRAGDTWTKVKQKMFDEIWDSKPAKKNTIKKPKDVDQDKGQGGTIEQRVEFFQKLLKPCKFAPTDWSKYGLHAVRSGSDKRPSNFKLALTLLEKEGLSQQRRFPMSSEFADRNAQRAVTMYSDKYGNSVNTVSQKSDNGKADFYIINVNPKMTQDDRNRLSSVEKKIDDKLKAAKEKKLAMIKSKPKVKK
jgi:hypothetical protein